MRQPKFSLNAFLLIVIIFSALNFFVTVKLTKMADRRPVNIFSPIEGTDLSVRYSSLEQNGIYRGDENTGTLMHAGDFGADWGAAAEGKNLYLNAYRNSDLGMVLSDVVRVDTKTFEKDVLLRNAILRGRCTSGELVCLRGALLPANLPQVNALCRLYAFSDPSLTPSRACAEVVFLDPETGRILYETEDDAPFGDDFTARYLDRTLEEVRP